MSKSNNSSSKNSSDERATPPWLIRRIRNATNGIDLDVAAGAERIQIAEERYTIEDDGLSSPWYGTVWCNPPYSEPKKWVHQAIDEFDEDDDDLFIFLVKGDCSTEWWNDLNNHASCVCRISQRLSFGKERSSAPFSSHIFVMGEPSDKLKGVLEDLGAVVSTQTQEVSK